MLQMKVFFLLLIFLSIQSTAIPQSFTFSGPTSSIIAPFGATEIRASYTFQYQNTNNAFYSELVIVLDGEVITSGLCKYPDPWKPSEYWFPVTTGTHSVIFRLLSLKPNGGSCTDFIDWQSVAFTLNVSYTLQFTNNFPGGLIGVDNSDRTSPYERISQAGQSIPIEALDQFDGTDYRVWNTSGNNLSNWTRTPFGGVPIVISNSKSIVYNALLNDISTKITANLRKRFNYSFTNQFTGTTQTGQFTINGAIYNAPVLNITAVEGNNLIVSAVYEYHNMDPYFTYRFYQWSDGSAAYDRTITPMQSQNLNAIYKRVPKFGQSLSNLQITTTGGSSNKVKITWNDLPDAGVVSYQIWRLFKRVNGELQVPLSPVYYATVNRGVQQFIDANLTYNTNDNDNYEIAYIVRPYYSPDQTLSDNVNYTSFVNVYQNDQQSGPLGKSAANNTVVTEYSLKSYPNPFNPTTQIEYALKKDGFVSLKIYDITGCEVATLVNERLSIGRYTAEFNASNLSSGVYLCTIRVNDYFATKKIILTK